MKCRVVSIKMLLDVTPWLVSPRQGVVREGVGRRCRSCDTRDCGTTINDGGLVASDALLMCFYMQHPNERIAPAVMRALELFRERIHPYQIEWYVG